MPKIFQKGKDTRTTFYCECRRCGCKYSEKVQLGGGYYEDWAKDYIECPDCGYSNQGTTAKLEWVK
jgi:hypothetical protein